MVKTYLYNERTYTDEVALRNAIFERDRLALCSEPEMGKAEFWSQFDVVYTEEPDPQPALKELKETRLRELDRAFYRWRTNAATLISSLGFIADADQRAMIDIAGLAALDSPAVFMDADNQAHELTPEQIKTLQKEVIRSGSAAYQTKWTLRNAIETAESNEELEAIEIKFESVDFSRA